MTFGKIGARRMMHRGPMLPPGARWVEYLENTGTQWINTGIYMNTDTDAFDTSVYIKSDASTWAAPMGSQSLNQTPQYLCLTTMNPVSNIRWVSPTLAVTGAGSERWLSIHIESGNSTIAGTSFSDEFDSVVYTAPFALFGRADNQPSLISSAKCRISQFKYYRSGVKILDFAPIAVGTTGYMMDILTGLYLPYGNAGTGDFVIGPDAPPPTI